MNIFLILILDLISYVFFIGGEGQMPNIMCGYFGKTMGSETYQFSPSTSVLDGCEAILFSAFFFDFPMVDEDKNNIASLVTNGKKVYVLVSYKNEVLWDKIMNAADTKTYSEQVYPLVTFLKENKINGVFLDMLGIFRGEITDYPCKLHTFVCRLKEDIPSLKVGMVINGYQCNRYISFDFNMTNDVVDTYLVDISSVGIGCSANTSQLPRTPQTDPDPHQPTIDCIATGVSLSSIDKDKLMVNIVIEPQTTESPSTFNMFCSQNTTNSTTIWCLDTSQEINDLVISLKKIFKAILVAYLDADDFNNVCGCGNYPVANEYIDAWQSKTVKCCAKIDNMKISN